MRVALLLASLLLLPIAAAAPEQVHVGFREGDALASYAVSWVETDPAAPATLTFVGPEGEVEIEGALRPGPTPGLVYEARLPALAAGQNASYRIGEREFPLHLPQDASNLSVAFLGDMGTTREAGDAVRTIDGLAPTMVLHVGDVSYAGGDPVAWKAWFDLVEPVAASVPWVPALGNHEGDVQGLQMDEANVVDPAEQAFFEQRFPHPGDEFWFSFDVGSVHFVALDTFSELQMPAAEAAWLEADLAAASDAAWTIAFLHEPPFSSNAAHGSSARVHEAFADILAAGGVDLVVTGHDHSYERTRPQDGVVYVVTGGGGASLYTEFVEPQPEWSAIREAAHHVLSLTITDARLDARAIRTGDGSELDAFSLVRELPADPAPASAPVPLTPLIAIAALAFASLRRR